MNWQDRIYENLVEDSELDEASMRQKVGAGVLGLAALAGGVQKAHKGFKARAAANVTKPLSVDNPNHPDYKPKNPAEAAAIKQHRKDSDAFHRNVRDNETRQSGLSKDNINHPDYKPKNPAEAASIEAHRRRGDERFRGERERRDRGGR